MYYTLIFDAAAHPYKNLLFALPGFAFVLIGGIMVFRPEWLEAVFRQPLRQRYIFRWFFFLFAIFWTVTATAGLLREATRAVGSTKAGRCEVVEGRVENFHPMPAEGHDTERFTVRGIEFNYSDFIVSTGFNNTASHGGPIQENLPVRICHKNGQILRLEIAK